MHAQLAAVLDRLGRGSDAARQLHAAAEEIERLRKGLDATQLAAFDRLPTVKQVTVPEADDQAA
jgi:hypothetical protein